DFVYEETLQSMYSQFSGGGYTSDDNAAVSLFDAIQKRRKEMSGRKPTFAIAISFEPDFDREQVLASGFLGFLRSLNTSNEAKIALYSKKFDVIPDELMKNLSPLTP